MNFSKGDFKILSQSKKFYLKHPMMLCSLYDTKFLNSFLQKKMWPRSCECMFCGSRFHNYRLHGYISELAEKHKVSLGPRFSDCPYCGSVDKYRWLWFVLQNHTDLLKSYGGQKLLHFAPEGPIKERIKACFKGEYFSGDIMAGRADYVVDMTEICFENNFFDYIIACNVLEHIPQEKKAIAELKRVIKSGGIIILSFPVAFDMNTYEDASLSEEEKIKNFGQEDHVRIYGIDYVERFERYGFEVKNLLPSGLMSKREINKNGFKHVSPILLLKKL